MGLKDMRKQAGLTQVAAAELFKLKYRTYQNYENGVTSPGMDTAAMFARYFGCSIGDLFDLREGSSSCALTQREQSILRLFGKLNDEGCMKLIEYADDLISTGKYSRVDA